nr:MAG: hypothetical protein KatS3mg041_1772 [Bacteroidota bacterium]
MGRALLLYVAGAGMILGLLFWQLRGQNLEDVRVSSRYYERVLAREIARTGLAHGMRRLLEAWPMLDPIEARPYQGGHYTVSSLELGSGSVRLEAIGVYGRERDTVAVVLRRAPSPIPDFPAALTVASLFSDEVSASFRGNAFQVDGRDHDLNGAPLSEAQAAYGILATRPGIRDRIRGALSGQQYDNVQGRDGLVPNVVSGSAGFDVSAFLDQLLASEAQLLPARMSGNYTLGSFAQPILARAPNGLELSGAICGVGILLVDGYLRLSGNVRWHGLLVVRNGEDLAVLETVSGTPQIIGAMLVYNSAFRPISLRINGNPSLLYSSEALEWLRRRLHFGQGGIEIADWVR